MTHSIFQPPIPERGSKNKWQQLAGCGLQLAIAKLIKQWDGAILLIVDDPRQLQLAENELKFFAQNKSIYSFPDWECLPYDHFSPHHSIISQRLALLARLSQGDHPVIISSLENLMQKLPPTHYIQAHAFQLKVGQELNIDAFRTQLQHACYLSVSQVISHSEYAIRGGLIDIFPNGSEQPFRIDLFDNQIESIRHFDPETQRSTEAVDQIELLPAKEFSFDEQSINQFRTRYRDLFEGDYRNHIIYNEVSQQHLPSGIEYYMPLFYPQADSLFDYLDDQTLVIHAKNLIDQSAIFQAQIQDRFSNAQLDKHRPPLPINELYLSGPQIMDAIANFTSISLASKAPIYFDVQPPYEIDNEEASKSPYQALNKTLSKYSHKTLIVAESQGREQALLDLLKNDGHKPLVIDAKDSTISAWDQFIDSQAPLAITAFPLDRGLTLDKENITIICESQFYGNKVYYEKRQQRLAHDPDKIIRSLNELKEGDAIVHIDHGVGRYRGLRHITVDDISAEFIVIEYDENAKLFVPILSLHLVNRFTGGDPEHAPLHKLGNHHWNDQKQKAKQKAYDIAVELLEIEAIRHARRGLSYEVPGKDYYLFCDRFDYEETPDQRKAIEDVIADMVSDKPMDRLICGDVGFGKTEVAMRAAFVAVHNNAQVCVLVPTTLLAQQHYDTFIDRFVDQSIRVDHLSRLRSTKESTQIKQDLEAGRIDILIGTHALLQNSIKYKNLGLVIIDEEHRFGVKQKEQIKKLRAHVDILALSATPIPRTLNMVMSHIRDISLIATPPRSRLAIKTFVRDFSHAIITEAVNRELHRGGQVYFIHNEVRTMSSMAQELQQLFPNAQIGIGHGQMNKHELENVMQNFYHQRFNIFLCTTIVESGIDNAHANTIIINQADRFGLAQLHQLRGRVGRSHHQAFAYLFVNDQSILTKDAKKRLEAISQLEELGAGFTLASHDLEIRGAGELLGESQSGTMDLIGLNLYTEYLQQAIRSLNRLKMYQQSTDKDLQQLIADPTPGAEVLLHMSALIPDDYISDVHLRLVQYKRIASCADEESLYELKVELTDRFGLMPDSLKRLFDITSLKVKASNLGIEKIDIGENGGSITFIKQPNIKPEVLIMLVQTQHKMYKLAGPEKLSIHFDNPQDNAQRIDWCNRLFAELDLGY